LILPFGIILLVYPLKDFGPAIIDPSSMYLPVVMRRAMPFG